MPKPVFNNTNDPDYQKLLSALKCVQHRDEPGVKELLEKKKEKEKIEELIKLQDEQTESYDSYLKFSNKEFERRLRKQKREKLTDISDTKNKKDLEITEEISQKIEMFKKQMEKRSGEQHHTLSDSSADPLKLIRERKRKKKEEYEIFKDHFESD